MPVFTGHFYNASTDAFFHFDRFENVIDALSHGQVPSLFNFMYYPTGSYAGVATTAMYPWLGASFFILPRLIIVNPITGLFVGFVILNFITMMNAHALLKQLTNSPWAIWAGVLIYEFNHFHIIDLYSRSAFGESIAYAWFPLVFLGLIRITQKQKSGKYLLAISMGLLLNTHVLSALMAMLVIVGYELIQLATKKISKQQVKDLFISVFLSAIIALYSLINILFMYRTNDFVSPTRILYPVDSGLFFHELLTNDVIDRTTWGYGLPAFLFQLFLTMLLVKNCRTKKWWTWVLIADGIFVVTLNILPWHLLLNSPMSLFQFLSRFYLLIVLFLAIAAAYYFDQKKIQKKLVLILSFFTIVLSMSAISRMHLEYLGVGTNHDRVTAENYVSFLNDRAGFSDYLPADKKTKMQLPVLETQNIQLIKTGKSNDSVHYKMVINTHRIVDLPIVLYQKYKYRILLDGQEVKSQSKSQVSVLAGPGKHIISVQYVGERNTLALLISLLGFMLVLILLWCVREKRNEGENKLFF
ncbi:hypothetical protein [Fructobacillus fructosus]|uniref:hypothetical protein n=1 Tax=Fructobacillus fructosus TaxID=1631 RepID=UPI0030C8B61C